jgi:hypothetical protein
MHDTVRDSLAETTDFWRPPLERLERNGGNAREKLMCSRCDAEFVFGSRFCHVCGAEREPKTVVRRFDWRALWSRLQVSSWPQTIGLNPAAFTASLVGVACVIACVLTGLMYQVQTTLDWQAIQMWRVEWLLGAIAAFLLAILLRKS